MGYYHKYRPQKFSDLIGQDHVKKTILNSLKSGKTGHAYLFSGPRGIGKTSVARLLAKSLNCQKQDADFEPCNSCQNCQDVLTDKSLDVIEIDAASNRGIDEIRDLREKIKFAPSSSKYKVFIIDEVHMLTKEAFNALLKTLEEPPKHAIFVMATTELHKIPATILSRVQQFDFRRASVDNIFGNIKNIARKEKIEIDDPALRLVAIMGDGSYRDATSILDQVSSIGDKITIKDVQDLLGLSEERTVIDLIIYLRKPDHENALGLINQLFMDGMDLIEFNKKIIEYFRKILIARTSSELIANAELTDDQKKEITKVSQKFSQIEIIKIIKIFIEAGKDMKGSSLPQIPLELAVVDVCNLFADSESSSEKIEEKITKKEDLKPTIEKSQKSVEMIIPIEKSKPIENPEPDPKPKEKTNLESSSKTKDKWSKLLEEVASKNRSLYLILKESEPRKIENDRFYLAVKYKFYMERIQNKKNYHIFNNAVKNCYGGNYALECIVDDSLAVTSVYETEDVIPGVVQAPPEKKDEETEEVLGNVMEVFET